MNRSSIKNKSDTLQSQTSDDFAVSSTQISEISGDNQSLASVGTKASVESKIRLSFLRKKKK